MVSSTPALQHLSDARAELEKLKSHERWDRANALIGQAVEEIEAGVEEQKVDLEDKGTGWAFYAVKDPEKTIGFEVDHESVRYVVIEVDDMTPEEAAQRIIDAKAKGATYRTA